MDFDKAMSLFEIVIKSMRDDYDKIESVDELKEFLCFYIDRLECVLDGGDYYDE